MKKIIFLVVACVMAMTSFAKSDLKVKSGSMAWAKEKVKVAVKIDLSASKWDEKEDFKTWCGEDYDARVNISLNSFINGFNNKSKGAEASANEEGAKYIISIKINNMEWRQSFTGMWGQFHVRCWGMIEVTDATTGESICTVEIDGACGDGDFVPNDRFQKCYEEVGEVLAKTKK